MRVDIEWDPNRGFIATAFELKHSLVALSLSELKHKLRAMFPSVGSTTPTISSALSNLPASLSSSNDFEISSSLI